MRPFSLSLLLLLLTFTIKAQFPGAGGAASPAITGKITGSIIDSTTREVVEFATIALRRTGSTKDINGTLTDEKGSFKLENVSAGKYTVIISFLGFNTKTITNIELTPKRPDANIGTVMLAPEGVALSEVTVEDQASLVENRIDKLVYNAEKDASSAGGSAVDVLQKVPMLSVDLDGNVSLRGSQSIRILINGKPSGMFSSNVADALKMIPADQIKSVEVITNPSAKYDGEGTGGIINIITKKKNAQGTSGSINSAIGTRQNNTFLNLGVRKGRFGLAGGGGSFWGWPGSGTNTLQRINYVNGLSVTTDEAGTNKTSRLGYFGNMNADYDFNAFNSISSTFRANGFTMDQNSTTAVSIADQVQSQNFNYDRINTANNGRGGFDWNTDFKRTFKKKDQELGFAFQWSNNKSITDNLFITENSPYYNFNQKSNNDGINNEYTFQVDYTHPFSAKAKMEIGGKTVIRHINSDLNYFNFNPDLNEYIADAGRLSLFKYSQDVTAGYASFNVGLSKTVSLLAGARLENTVINGKYTQGAGDPFSNDYANVLPNISISKQLPKFRTIKLGYSKRIQRPSLFYINPFQNAQDTRNITVGNPTLNPELTDQVELALTTFLKGSMVNLAFYAKHTNDIIENLTEIQNNGSSIATYKNAGDNYSYGFNAFSSVNLSKKWTLRGNVNVGSYNTVSDLTKTNFSTGVQYNAFLMSSFDFKKNGLKADLFGIFNSPRRSLQGTTPSFSMYSMGLKKEILKKKGTLGFSTTTPFTKYRAFKSEIEGDNFKQVSNFKIPFASFGVSFSYQWGKMNFNAQPKKRGVKNDDLKQGEGGGDMGNGGGGVRN
ncbi:MAG: TonB-dependent receptor [Saprospiraceae bacterium]|jgi:outer membrane receptor protein involved in Fe transport|nr:TonB-dependent receptor [Saprospiraceae bacterium]MBK6478936.1 TonB-dependent receptor [Saprospiraceae bacterium]MBK8513612.1 TonB-dependent receptor [Saprospiraceae bacterium]MBK8778974.1 TonB-dependent receptor [Saprospiraceae bacterium]MBK9680407.1 TonB-dependent receptor [Saprospiraceae bacterium]